MRHTTNESAGHARLQEASRRIREAALAAADPYVAVEKALRASPPALRGRLFLAAVGKASARMAAAALDFARAQNVPIADGLVVLPHGYPTSALPRDFPGRIRSAGHPVPDDGSAAAALELMALADRLAPEDFCLFLLSGGGSSLLSLPQPPVRLEDLAETNRLLLACGAGIREINTVRRHLSAIAGGRLAARCRGTVHTLVVSDVVGDDLSAIASGPTVADSSTFADARAVLAARDLLSRVPVGVRALLEEGAAGRVPDTPKVIPARHHAQIIASGRVAVEAAAAEARAQGFTPRILTTELSGEARDAGGMLANAALEARRGRRELPLCIIAAGETTVTVKGAGRGGRNQELALAAARALEGTRGILLTSFASDGIEGNTEAAGAHASGSTIEAGRRAGLDEHACLSQNNSHAFLAAAGELIVTGPTGTNVNDVSFVLVDREE